LAKTVEQRLQVLDDIFTDAVNRGLMQRVADDDQLDGRLLGLDGKQLVNFGSCSYLGLEMDPRLKEGVAEAVMRYGTQFSSSRSYISAPPYVELEGLLEELFGGAVMIAPSTTLGHQATLPVLVGENDAVVLDQQVHHSIHMAVNQVRVIGTTVEMVRHNRMDLLEERIVELGKTHERVWYMADGIYSMFADVTPTEELEALMERHEQLHLYIDDSHGMSWSGENGRGYVLGRMPIRDRMFVACSLNKAFAAAGGAFIFPSEELRRKVMTCGGPMIFSGPIQPPMLGAALASARIHLSPEIYELQAQLRDRVQYCNALMQEFELPLIAPSEAPIRYVGVGLPRIAYNIADRMMGDGLYVNVAPFPAVPMKQGGIRTPLTVHHTHEDIQRMVESLARALPVALAEEGSSLEELHQNFGLEPPAPRHAELAPVRAGLRIEHHTSIDQVDAAEWDRLLGHRGSFSAAGLRLLETTFRDQQRPEDNWAFHYFVVRDEAGTPVLATFFSQAIWKDDMASPAAVSRRVEKLREGDRYHLTSQTLAMGSLLTEGEHLYIDRERDWQAAIDVLLEAVSAVQEQSGADNVVLRDFPDPDPELELFMRERGFVKAPMLDSLVLDSDFSSDEEWFERISYKSRRHQRREVLPFEDAVEVELLGHGARRPGPEEVDHLYALYLGVHARGLDLNVFDLPRELFERMLEDPSWELLTLKLDGRVVAMVCDYIGCDHYSPLVIGLDYDYVRSHHIYRVALLKMMRRAVELGKKRVCWGMGATLEKRRFGAQVEPRCAYVQAKDHYAIEVLAQVEADARSAGELSSARG
jgi:7-keto-8-aminopelargonate synthetase-like enzyme/predicted N-acyltransferase